MRTKKILKIMSVVFAVTIITGYTYYQSRAIIYGPEVTITSPPNGKSFNDSLVEIEGITKNITHLSLNNKTIFVNKSGVFNEKLLIYKGLNIIEVKAVNKFGRTVSKTLQLVLLN